MNRIAIFGAGLYSVGLLSVFHNITDRKQAVCTVLVLVLSLALMKTKDRRA